MRKIMTLLMCCLVVTCMFIMPANAKETINTEEELYQAIANDCMNFKKDVTYTIGFKTKYIDINRVKEIIRKENEALSGNFASWSYYISGDQVDMEFTYLLSKTEYKSCRKMAEDIGKQFTEEMTDYQKIKATHDYLCNAFVYSYFHDGPFDAFFKGTTDCEGYAMTFQMVMDYCNIPCKYITDDTHAWNIVQVDGGWYNIDVTWDDTDDENVVRYDYFLKSANDFDGHKVSEICEKTNYPADLSYQFPMKNLTKWHKYVIMGLVGAIMFVFLFEKIKHSKRVQKDDPITFKEYNWSEQRAKNAQNKTVDNTIINGEIISKKENNNESKS